MGIHGHLGTCAFQRCTRQTRGLRLAWLLAALGLFLLGPSSAKAEVGSFEVREYEKDFEVSGEIAERNLETQRRGVGIVGQLRSALDKRYAGVWFDNETGEFVVPILNDEDRSVVATLLAADDLQRDHRIERVASSWNDLEMSQARLNKALDRHLEEQLLRTALDPRSNAVLIRELRPANVLVEAELRRLVASETVNVNIKHSNTTHFGAQPLACKTTTPRACGRPLRGGVSLTRTTEEMHEIGECSVGFKATNALGDRFVLTSGHCAEKFPKWGSEDANENFHAIGIVNAYSFPGGDWASIKANGSSTSYWDVNPWPSQVAHFWEDQERAINSESWSYLGQYVCHSGTKTGTSCGNVSAVNITEYGVDHLTEFGKVCGLKGDSGGPVFIGNTALGLLSGGDLAFPECERPLLYVEITEATDSLGVSVGTRIGEPPPPPPVPPTAQTEAAAGIEEDKATLKGTINPNGSATSYRFEYGVTTAYGNSVPIPEGNAGSTASPVPVSAGVSGLQPRTRYHYRIVASNSAGTSYGIDKTFTTGLKWVLRNSNSSGLPNTAFWFGLPGDVPVVGDWNGDGVATIGVYDSGSGVWKLRNSNSTGPADISFQYGGPAFKPVAGDWDGNGTATIGLYEPTAGTWALRNSNSGGGADIFFQYGGPQFLPVAGDWNGNGTATIGLYEPNGGTWALRNSNSGGNPDISFQYGGSQFKPLAGDWDGNGTTTIGLYESSAGGWSLRNSNSGGGGEIDFQYGGSQFTAVAGDWDGNGTDTAGLSDPDAISGLSWLLRNSNSPGAPEISFESGLPGEVVVAGDWNGDGIETNGVYDPASGVWKLRNSNSTGQADVTFQYGGSQFTPVTGDWDGNGTTTIGLYEPTAGTWALRNSNSGGGANIFFQYGGSAFKPVTGDWNGNGTATIGLYEPNGGTWALRNSNSGGNPDISFQYGGSQFKPLAGDWDGNGTATIGLYESNGGIWALRNSNSGGNPDISFQYGGPIFRPIAGDWDGNGTATVGLVTP